MKLIFANSYGDFAKFCLENNINRAKARYISTVSNVYGITGTVYVVNAPPLDYTKVAAYALLKEYERMGFIKLEYIKEGQQISL